MVWYVTTPHAMLLPLEYHEQPSKYSTCKENKQVILVPIVKSWGEEGGGV